MGSRLRAIGAPYRLPSCRDRARQLRALYSSDHFEPGEGCFVDFQPKPWSTVTKLDKAVPCDRLALENIPEQFVSDFHIARRKIFGDWRIQARNDHMIIVHLPRMRHDRD